MKKTMSSIKGLFAKFNCTLFRALAFLCPLFLTFAAIKPFAANQIIGTVLDADSKLPLKNALVSLKSTGDLVLTNENGTFSLIKTEVKTLKANKTACAVPFKIKRDNIQLNITAPNTPVKLVILNLNGQTIHKTTKIFQPGFQNVDLSKLLSTNATHILQLKINQKNYITKILPSAVRPSGSPLVSSLAVRQFHSLAVSSPETLLVSKYLYTPQLAPVTATTAILLNKPAALPPPPGMKAIPGGAFMRGSNRPFAEVDEQPIKEITISPFFLDSTEVTQADYFSLFNTAPWFKTGVIKPSPFPGSGNNYPVWNINWYDAALYCNTRSKRDGLDTVYVFDSIIGNGGHNCVLANVQTNFDKKGYRLPTEAEWEYAARSGTTTDYYWGNYTKQDLITPKKYAWYSTNIASAVAMKIPNNFGLYDMSGNVYEFANDYYNARSYTTDDIIDPKGVPITEYRVQRGGYWGSVDATIRSSDRMGIVPADAVYFNGFRVALPNK